ncbi:hypothetical protein B0O99DRAFT_544433 [Bisporella sp. PMI_857]|nr:hypothetical protein B0O99DRAFT_544433 [Bisporella sp. PMI_857]
MATTNGILSPPPHTTLDNLSLSAKRKREDSTERNHINGSGDSISTTERVEDQSLFQDLMDVLKSYDPSSILTSTLADRTSSNEPQPKRQKPNNTAGSSTILARTSSSAYSTVEEVLQDIDAAVSDALKKLDLPSNTSQTQYSPVPPEKTELSLQISAFKNRAYELIEKELAWRKTGTKPNGVEVNGHVFSNNTGIDPSIRINGNPTNNKTVLTLYGNAPQAKQLFSSLQASGGLPGESQKVVQAVREAGLPIGITTTQVVPIQSTGVVDDKKRVKTLGDLFHTPLLPHIRPLEPPKSSRTTRGNKVGWYQPTLADELPKSSVYFEQKISTGQWIDYSNASPTQGGKRKSRDRAISLGGSKVTQVESEPKELEAAKLDALFRGAYTSFAPTKDNSAAIVPEGLVDKMWWQQIGEKSFDRFIENAQSLEDISGVAQLDGEPIRVDDNEDTTFKGAVEWYESQAIDPALVPSTEKSVQDKDIEEVLEGISELLETLNSYQRNRNISLNPPTRPVGLLSATDNAATGTPPKPSDSEMATYEILKSQLTMMISSLPPFAVAKLDPHHLSELSISTKLPIQVENYNGVMEEDEATLKAKQASMSSSASRNAQPQGQRVNQATPYNTQYQAPRAPAPTQQYYNTTHTPIRPPNMQRPPASAPAPYPLQRPSSSTSYRPQTYGTPSYSQQTTRPVQQQYSSSHYGPSNPGSYSQTPTQGYARPIGQSYQNAPQAALQAPIGNRYAIQQTYQQQTPAQNGASQQYSNGNSGGQPSPKPSSWGLQGQLAQHDYAGRNGSYPTSTPTYSGSNPLTNPNQRAYSASPATQSSALNGGASQSPRPQPAQQTQHTSGANNYSTFLSAEQQSNLSERQRATLAAQQQNAQPQARQAAQPGALGSPAQGQVNGGMVVSGS